MLSSTVRPLILSLAILGVAAPASAQHDELYYPASQCVPFNANMWQGSGAAGFAFVPGEGGWYNYDRNAAQALVCPVPYVRDTNDLQRIVARIVVDDRNFLGFTRAFLCGKSSTGGKFCTSMDNFPSIVGVSTIELSIQPVASTRFVWIEVEVPEDVDDNNPFTSNGTSGVIGYRVFRTP